MSKAGDILKKAKVALAAILALLVIIISFQNTEIVTIQLLFWNLALSRVLVLFVTFFLGAFAGILGSYLFRVSKIKRRPEPEPAGLEDE